MNKLTAVNKVLEKVNFANFIVWCTIGLVAAFPFIVVGKIIYYIWHRYHPEKEEPKTEQEMIAERIERGELSLSSLPHTHNPLSDRFSFKAQDSPRYSRTDMLYVATAEDMGIRAFLAEEKAWLDAWTEKYGFNIVVLDNQEELLSQMCFPQDRALLEHGFLNDLNCWTSEREYHTSVMPFRYFPLKDGDAESLRCQINLIAQEMYEEKW